MKVTQEKGITLIALVVTIIVLIILAGVSINLLFNEYGIVTRAQNAKQMQTEAQVKENIQLKLSDLQMEKMLKGKDITTYDLETIITQAGGETVKDENGNITGVKVGDAIIPIEEVTRGVEISGLTGESTGGITVSITASDIEADASYIGKYVNYGGQDTYKGVKWRIFNAENGQIQLIADNYIHKDVMPTAANILRGEEDGADTDYCVYTSDNRITLLNYINTTSNWSDFVAVTGATVTGSPTIEQFKNSYNRTHGASSEATVKEIFIAKSSAMEDGLEGNYVGKSENPRGYSINGLNTTEIENLYVIDDNTNANAYWLGSPSAYISAYLMIVGCDGYMGYYDYLANYFALRPLVLLPSGITLVEQENGTYNIQ